MFQRQKYAASDKELDVAHSDASATERHRAEWGDASNVEITDEELIERLASGDLAALDTLYTRYARPVFSLALRILSDSADAEEVTQDVFERVWRHAPSFDGQRGRFGTWLLSMTHHVAIDRVRKRQRRPQQVPAQALEWAPPDPPSGQDVPESVLRNLQAEQVRRALRSLPSAQQQAIELAYFGGLSHLEIAAALGDPLGTVKARIRRGMDRLRSALERYVTEGEEV
jgi:RNA polymerase sigma-70 factor (ECF subfamily)